MLKTILYFVLSVLLCTIALFTDTSFAHEEHHHMAKTNQESAISVENSYIKETIPGTTISSAYMMLHNNSNNNIRLVAATSSISQRIEIHEHIMQGDLMKMRQRQYVEINANDCVEFQPSGYHLMIFDIKKPLKAGETIMITLHFNDQSRIDVNYTVKGLKRKAHHHHH